MNFSSMKFHIHKYKTNSYKNPGIVAVETLFIFSKIFTSQVPAERFTVSEIGDILSPKIAPQITAAAVISGDTPNPPPIPIKATPKVAAVPQEVPVQSVAIAQVKLLVTKKIEGEIIFNP